MEGPMIFKQNPLTGDWLCFIPGTPVACYIHGKKAAALFTEKINQAFTDGLLILDKNNKLKPTHPKTRK